MTVFEAKQLIARYHYSAVLTPLLEAAKFARLMSDLEADLSLAGQEALCKQLHLRTGRGVKNALTPPLTILREAIDRRQALGIADVRADAEQEYRMKGRERGARERKETAA